jgi:hypothetical protein
MPQHSEAVDVIYPQRENSEVGQDINPRLFSAFPSISVSLFIGLQPPKYADATPDIRLGKGVRKNSGKPC